MGLIGRGAIARVAAGATAALGIAASAGAVVAAVVSGFGGASPATAQIEAHTNPDVLAGLFVEGCVRTAPSLDQASAVFEREGLAKSPVVFDQELFTGPSKLVSALVEKGEAERTCRVVGRGVDERAVGEALERRLRELYGARLEDRSVPGQGRSFLAPTVLGPPVRITMTPTGAGEEPRAMMNSTIAQ